MKYPWTLRCAEDPSSPPSRGAWIEIVIVSGVEWMQSMSPPSRGAWIEIIMTLLSISDNNVAPLAGGVD